MRLYWLAINAFGLHGEERDVQDSEAHDDADSDFGPFVYSEVAKYHDWNEGTE